LRFFDWKAPDRRRYALSAGALIAAAATLTGCSGSKPEAPHRPTPVVGYIIAEQSAVPMPVTLGGRTVAVETSEVRPEVGGIIRKQLFTEGGLVQKGQPLFEIDPSVYRAAVSQAAANLQSARANAVAAIAKEQRYKPLAEMEAVAKQDYVDAVAQAGVARAAIAQNQAALETAQINLRYTTVPAPISGRIGRSLVTVGALASASQATPLAIIQRTDPIYVDMQQSASDLLALRRQLANGGATPGSTTVHLRLDDGSAYPLAGTVKFSEVTVDQSTGTVTLRAQFPNPKYELLPGMFVSANFDQAINPNAFLIPQPAVQHDFDNSAFVMLVGADGKVVRRKITADHTYGSNYVVTEGLNRGEKVILQGLNGLRSGSPVKAVPASMAQDIKPPQPNSGEGGRQSQPKAG
jgi:membrane fusion protein (multidrug efflux system)